MDELQYFVIKLDSLADFGADEMPLETARGIIKLLNNFLYTSYDGIGTVYELEQERPFVSDLHRYWNRHYEDILDVEIDAAACSKVAECLHGAWVRTNGKAFSELYDTYGLDSEAVCRVRFLTANQDFKTSLDFKKLAAAYKRDKSIFDERRILNNPEAFLSTLKLGDLSQSDKRAKFAKTTCKFLIDRRSSPYGLIDYYGHDLTGLREDLINCVGAGYGNKKTDMFIRDMCVLVVWKNVSGFEAIDVASDSNTMKVALRTGIITTAIPLVSSFLDYFGLQYTAVERASAAAWRTVWEIWREKYPHDSPESPCLLDYFVYDVVGKQFCKEILVTYTCENGHVTKGKSGKRKCPVCKGTFQTKSKNLPCEDAEGYLALKETAFYKSHMAKPNYTHCPFESVCIEYDSRGLNPPKAISILGRTGWAEAYAYRDMGGGGISS